MLQILFFLGMVTIPFNGIRGVGALGELAHEASVYPLMIVIFATAMIGVFTLRPIAGKRSSAGNGSPLLYIFGAILLVLTLSVIINISSIATNSFHLRSGFTKLALSSLVLFYGMGLCYATYRMAPGRWQSLIIMPIAISAVLCMIYSVFEVAAQHGIMNAFYSKMSSVVHANTADLVIKWNGKVNFKVVAAWDRRIRSLCFEPPAFGNFSGFAWPWLLAGCMSNTGAPRRIYAAILFLFTLLILVAKARTGWIMLGVNVAVLSALRFIYLSPVPGKYNRQLATGLLVAGVAVSLCAGIYYLINFQSIAQKVIEGSSVSNLSRLASQVSAVNMFRDHPLLGVGLGQYGFYVTQYMPSWGYLSYELRPWLIYPTAPWPSVYSMYARLAAETGIVGLAGWIGLWLFMAYEVVRKSRLYLALHGKLPTMAYPLVLSYFTVLVSSTTTDTLRTPMIWISLGLGCAYLNGLALKKKEYVPANDTKQQPTPVVHLKRRQSGGGKL